MREGAELLETLRRAADPRLVVLGGLPVEPTAVTLVSSSFDPLTLGHVGLVEAAAFEGELVLLVYAARTLPKEGDPAPPLLAEADRLEVVQRFCATRSGLAAALCSHGLLVEQAEAARRRFPGARLTLAMGSDKALQLLDPRWYEDRDAELLRLVASADIRFAVRAGDRGRVEATLSSPENVRFVSAFHEVRLEPSVAAISARQVRELARRGEPFEHLVPPEAVPAIRLALTGV